MLPALPRPSGGLTPNAMRTIYPPLATCLLALGLTACAATSVNEPSLARRPAEAIDPRVPIPSTPIAGPLDAALQAQLNTLLAAGQSGSADFDAEAGRAQSLAAAAGLAQSESWVQAQQSLSRLEGARSTTAKALADIDELAARRIQSGGLSIGDQAAIEAASAELRAVSDRQADVIASIGARLTR